MLQIGNNSFAEHHDLERFVAEKVREAEGLLAIVGVQPHETGLEIGCGTGVHTRYFAERSHFLWAVDVSDHWLELFDRMTAGVPNLKRLRSSFHPFLSLIPDASLDYAFSSAVFCHLHVYDAYLYFEELRRVLRPGGRFWFNYQNADRCDFGPFFQTFLDMYRRGGCAEPINPGSMQFHSRAYFRRLARRMGFTVRREKTKGTYTHVMLVRDMPRSRWLARFKARGQ